MKKLLRHLYQQLPFKRQVFELIRTYFTMPESSWKHLYFEGRFKVFFNDHVYWFTNYNSTFETSIFWIGTLADEKKSVEAWATLAKHSSLIFDVGANSGFYAICASEVNSQAHVVAFEPIQRIFSRLQENVKLNGNKVVVENLAISDSDGETVIYDLPVEHHYHASLDITEVEHHEGVVGVPVKVVCLDSYVREMESQNIDLLKIDVEGHEVKVIAGMSEVIERSKPSVLLEVKDSERARKIQKEFDGKGYSYYEIDEEKGLKKINSLSQSFKWNTLILSPKHHHISAQLPIIEH